MSPRSSFPLKWREDPSRGQSIGLADDSVRGREGAQVARERGFRVPHDLTVEGLLAGARVVASVVDDVALGVVGGVRIHVHEVLTRAGDGVEPGGGPVEAEPQAGLVDAPALIGAELGELGRELGLHDG
jgi:hypothetical protein